MTFGGIEAHLLDRKENKNLLEFKIGNTFRRDNLNSKFSLLENSIAISEPNGYQNDLSYLVNDLYLTTKYQYSLNKVKLIGNLTIHQLFNRLEQNNQSSSQQLFFINPSLGIDYKINNNNRIRTSYAHNRTNATVLNVYNDFVLTGFRNFNSGTGSFNQLDASAFLFNYQLGNWSDRFFANTIFSYTKNHDFFSTNTIINQNFTQEGAIVIKDREAFDTKASFDYFLKKISSNIKINLGFTQSEYKNVVNNSELREVSSVNYEYGIEFRSAFDSFFDFNIGSKRLSNEIKTTVTTEFIDNVSFLYLNFYLTDKFNMDLQTERYFFGNLQSDNTYYFLDFNARYTIKENKLTLMLSGKNLFNTDTFRNFTISDIGNSTTEYRLLPRYVLLIMEYRF